MMALGPFRFGIDSMAYGELVRSRGWVWAEQEVVGKAPVLQFTGEKAETIELKGTIYSSISVLGKPQLEAMAQLAGRGKPMLMVSGPGLVFGFYVIEHISQNEFHFTSLGSARKVEFHVSLKRYTDTAGAIAMMKSDPQSIIGF